MPLIDINEYLAAQRQKQGLEFLDKVKATGVDVEQFRLPNGGYRIPISGPNSAFVSQATPEPQSDSPLARGLNQVGADLASATSVLTGAVGANDWSKYFADKSDSLNAAVAANPSSVPNVEDIHSPGDLASYIYDRTVENVPMIASLLIPGGVIGKIGGKALGWSASALVDTGLQIGESATQTRQDGQNPIDMRVIGTGLGKAVLDMLPVFAIAKVTGIAPILEKSFIAELSKMGYLKRVAGEIPTIAAVEVPTEVAQEAMDIALQRTMQQKQGDLTDEEWSRLKNAAGGALAVSAGLGPIAGISKPHVIENADVPKTVDAPLGQSDLIPKSTVDKYVEGAPQLPGPPGGGGANFYVDSTGQANTSFQYAAANSTFDSNAFYDPKTGTPRISASELRSALIDSGRQIKYNGSEDRVIGTRYARTWKDVYPKWTTTPDGGAQLGEDAKITPAVVDGKPAYEVWSVFGTPLGTFPDMPTALQRGEEYAWQRTPKVSINENGEAVVAQPATLEDIATQEARKSKNPTATEQALLKIAEAKIASDRKPDLFEPNAMEQISVATADPQMMSLLEMRTEILQNKDLYTNDGALSARGTKQLGAVETRIQSLSDKLGVPNPLSYREHVLAYGKVEDQLGDIAARETISRQAPAYKNLTAGEAKLHDNLMEKEMVEGLTPREMDQLVALQERITEGDKKQYYRKPSKDELDEMRREFNDVEKIMADEVGRVKRSTKGQKASLDDEGRYLFARKGNVLEFPKFEVRDLSNGVVEVRSSGKQVGFVYTTPEGKYLTAAAQDYKGLMNKSVQLTKPIAGGLRWMNGGRDLEGKPRATYAYATSNDEFGFKHPDAYVVESRPGVWAAEPTLEGKETYGHFSSKEEAVKYLDQLFRPNSAESFNFLGEFTSLQDAVGSLRRHALEHVLRAPPSEFEKLRGKHTPLTKEQVAKAIEPIFHNLNIKPRIRIMNVEDFADATQRAFAESSAGYIDLHRAGEITLVADNLFSASQAQQILIHEAHIHYGLRAYFSPEELNAVLKEVLLYRQAEIRENAISRGELGKLDSGADERVLTLRDAEEFIARKAEEAYIRMKAGDRDWMRDKVWEPPGSRTFIQKIVALFKRILRRIGLNVRQWSDQEINSMVKDLGLFMSGKLAGRNSVGVDAHWKTGVMRSAVGPTPLSSAIPNMNSFAEVWGTKLATMFLTPLQMAEKYNIPGAKHYIEQVQLWWARKRDLTTEPVGVAEDWQKMPKTEMSKLSQAILEADRRSEELGRRLSDDELQTVFKEFNVGPTAQKIYTRMDQTFQTVLQKLQHGLELNALAEHTRDLDQAKELHALWRSGDHTAFFNRAKEVLGNLEVGGRLTEIEREMNILRDRNYFPHMRFGQYAVYIRAKKDLTLGGRDYAGPRNGREGQVVYFETFETYHAREARAKELLKEFPPSVYDAGFGKISDAEFTFLGMPPSLYEALDSRLGLDEKQRERLKELYFTRSPGRAFLKHLTKRKGVEGFSQDALRVYATYMMNAANHIARVEYHREMGSALSELRDAGQKMGDVAGFVRDYFAKHFDYIMNPGNDWASIRGLGFLWYLGFNVKSALVNLTQVPMVAYPYLASRYGDAATVGAISKAYGTVVRLMRGKSVLDDAAQVDINRAFREGVIDQAQATELAAISETPVLQRLLPTNRGQKLLSNLAYYGSFLFRHAETFNRRVTFLAARELALQRGLRGEDVYLAAKKAVQTSMFEYSKWNRPQYSQGKRSVFFLFWNYMQQLSFLAFGGEGKGAALRIWSLLLLTAGLQGLPFADDILDLLDLGSTKAKELLGMKDPHTELRLNLREIAAAYSDNPDLIMHGLSRYYGLGPLHLLELMGVPVPGADISGSLSAGRIVPGLQDLTGSTQDPDKAFGQAIVDALGPIGGIGYNFWRVITNRDPDTWKAWERAMPTAAKNASQAVRRWSRGEETFRGGGTVATFSPHDFQARAEVVAGAFGFQSPRISGRYEERSLQEELKQYWLSRRALVMENYAYAHLSHDQDALSDARKAVQRFNEDAPAPQMKISTDTLINSLEQRLHLRDLRSEALPPEDAFVPLYRRVTKTFPQNEELRSTPPAETPPPPKL